jgi:hypothetical protein
LYSHRRGHKADLLSFRDATILCGQPKNNGKFLFHFFPLFLFSLTTLDLIYPLLDNAFHSPPHTPPPPCSFSISPTHTHRPSHTLQGLPECGRSRGLHGLDSGWIPTRRPHDRQPSITHDPVCDAWIDRQVRPHFRLFGLLSPPLPHAHTRIHTRTHSRSPSAKLGSLIRTKRDPALNPPPVPLSYLFF